MRASDLRGFGAVGTNGPVGSEIPLSERLDDVARSLDRDGCHISSAYVTEAAELARRVEGAAVAVVASYDPENASVEFDTAHDLWFGQRVALVPVGDGGCDD